MNNLAPRQGSFAVILLVSFCLHIVILMFSTEKQQYDYRTDKGEKIVQQLGKEAMVALANQDRISLSVLANRYQVDSDVAKLVISDPKHQTLVQTGLSQTEVGQVIEQPIVQDNQALGFATVTMKAISKGEIMSNQWLFILGSAIVHLFLWFLYGYMARPTAKQLAQIGEKVQQRMAIARGSLPTTEQTPNHSSNQTMENRLATALDSQQADDDSLMLKKSIQDFLHATQSVETATPTLASSEDDSITQATPQSNGNTQFIELQIRFFDEFGLFGRVAPEIAKPYLQLCAELLSRACDSLFGSSNALINRYVRDVQVQNTLKFTEQGAVVRLTGKPEQLPLASVLLAKLVVILNQVVYEKHRELARFALPMTIGISLDSQFEETERLMNSHAKQDGLMLLLPKSLLKTLNGQVQLKNLPNPTSVSEREVVNYTGLAETLMAELIHKRDSILTEKDQ